MTIRARVAALVAIVLLAATALAGCGARPGAEGAIDASAVRAAPDIVTAPAVTGVPAPSAVPPTTAPPPLAPNQVLVAVAKPEVTTLATYDAPNGRPVTFEVPLTNPWYFGGELALLVTSGREGDEWLQVGIPTRPNGTTAWIRTADVTLRSHQVHVEISVAARRLQVWNGDALLVDTTVVVGKASTPTPLGHFFVNARIQRKDPAGAYGPWILSLSGFSEALSSFDGALPEIAMHGTNQADLIGQARSNGCIRMRNDVITQLAQVVPLGTPVDVVA